MMPRIPGLLCLLALISCLRTPRSDIDPDRDPPGVVPPALAGLTVEWANNTLRIRGPGVPGEHIEIWYLEAFCRSGSTHREWSKTTIPHSTELVESSPDQRRLQLVSHVEGGVEVTHHITAGADNIDFRVSATSHGDAPVDVCWVQPCMQVDRFTGREQGDYVAKCFVFVDGTLTTLDTIEREEQALYRGGQVYVPRGIDLDDVNPRPLSSVQPSPGIIGCYSSDGSKLLAMAWEPYQELFQGVRVCIHADFRLGGLEPGETKTARGKVYLLDNNPEELLARYQADFGEQ